MNDNENTDRIQKDAADIAAQANDLGKRRGIELSDITDEARIDAEIAELQKKRAAVDADRVAEHAGVVSDLNAIAEDEKDIRAALGGNAGGGPAPAPPPPAPPAAPPTPPTGRGPGPGPSGPPVVPPRRVG